MSVNDIGPSSGPQQVRVGDGSKAEPKTGVSSESSPESAKAGTGDRVSITSTAAVLQQAEEQLSKLPDVDHARVEAVRQAIENGSFAIDANRVAEKLIAFDTALPRRDD